MCLSWWSFGSSFYLGLMFMFKPAFELVVIGPEISMTLKMIRSQSVLPNVKWLHQRISDCVEHSWASKWLPSYIHWKLILHMCPHDSTQYAKPISGVCKYGAEIVGRRRAVNLTGMECVYPLLTFWNMQELKSNCAKLASLQQRDSV